MSHSHVHYNPVLDYIADGDVFEEEHCTLFNKVSIYSGIAVAGILFLISVFINVRYIYDHHQQNKQKKRKKRKRVKTSTTKTSKLWQSVFYLGIVFGVLSSLLILFSIATQLMICYHDQFDVLHKYHVFKTFVICYFVQLYLIWLILYIRLIAAFQSWPALDLRKCTKILYSSLFIIGPILTVLYVSFSEYEYHDDLLSGYDHWHYVINVIMGSLVMLMNIIFPLILTAIFIVKLFQLFKNRDPENDIESTHDKLIKMMTKNTILCITLIMCTIFTMAVSYLLIQTALWMVLIDIFVNFLCIMLSYRPFEHYYGCICKCCDNKLRRCGLIWFDKRTNNVKRGSHEYTQTIPTDTQFDDEEGIDIECLEEEVGVASPLFDGGVKVINLDLEHVTKSKSFPL